MTTDLGNGVRFGPRQAAAIMCAIVRHKGIHIETDTMLELCKDKRMAELYHYAAGHYAECIERHPAPPDQGLTSDGLKDRP